MPTTWHPSIGLNTVARQMGEIEAIGFGSNQRLNQTKSNQIKAKLSSVRPDLWLQSFRTRCIFVASILLTGIMGGITVHHLWVIAV